MRFRLPLTATGPAGRPAGSRPEGTDGAILAGAAALVAGQALLAGTLGASSVAGLVAAAVYAVVAGAVRLTIGATPQPRFGAANAVTLARAVLTALVAGTTTDLFLAPAALGPGAAWTLTAIALVALALDGVDGWLARRRNLSTRFGARFDMEVDALLILILSLAVVALDKAGAFAVLIGAMRYGFVAAGRLLPWLEAPLPPSFRRKAVCVVQAAVLCAVLPPEMPPALSWPLVLAALSALVWSFAEDVAWLRAHRSRRP